MTPNMPDWFRSAAVLGTAFVTVAVVTIGLAALHCAQPRGVRAGVAAARGCERRRRAERRPLDA